MCRRRGVCGSSCRPGVSAEGPAMDTTERNRWFLGTLLRILADSSDTGGQLAVMEQRARRGFSPPGTSTTARTPPCSYSKASSPPSSATSAAAWDPMSSCGCPATCPIPSAWTATPSANSSSSPPQDSRGSTWTPATPHPRSRSRHRSSPTSPTARRHRRLRRRDRLPTPRTHRLISDPRTP